MEVGARASLPSATTCASPRDPHAKEGRLFDVCATLVRCDHIGCWDDLSGPTGAPTVLGWRGSKIPFRVVATDRIFRKGKKRCPYWHTGNWGGCVTHNLVSAHAQAERAHTHRFLRTLLNSCNLQRRQRTPARADVSLEDALEQATSGNRKADVQHAGTGDGITWCVCVGESRIARVAVPAPASPIRTRSGQLPLDLPQETAHKRG